MNSVKLTYGDSVYEFSFGLYFLGSYLEQSGNTMESIFEQMRDKPLTTIPNMLYVSYCVMIELKGESVPISKLEFFNMLEDHNYANNPETTRWVEGFTASLTRNIPKEEVKKGAKDEVKKK